MRSLRFVFVLLCASGSLGTDTAVSHTGMPHADATLTSTVAEIGADRSNLENFVRHATGHLSEASSFAEVLELLNDFRNNSGDWNNDSTYLILLSRRGGAYVHSKSEETRELEDQDWSGLLVGCSQESWREVVRAGGGCVRYREQGEEVPSGYAVPFSSGYVPFGNPRSQAEQFVLVGGLDYTPEAEVHGSFEEMVDDLVDNLVRSVVGGDVGPDDQEFLKLYMQFKEVFFDAVTPETNSRDVSEPEDLKQFLDNAFTFITASFSISLFDSVVLRRVFRFEGGPWRNLSTYIYIMDDEGNVIFNGANRSIEQTNFFDDHPPELGELARRIIDTAKTRTENGKSFAGGFLEYDWDDPAVTWDDAEGPGGSSPKLAYVKAFSVDKDGSVDNPRIYIFGTGLYLGSQSEGGGCAVGKIGNSLGGTAINLFLTVFVLFSVVLWKIRSTFKLRN